MQGVKIARTSIDPAISICAHLILGPSSPSAGSTPSTNAFRNNAAVHDPARFPPVCSITRVSIHRQDGKGQRDRTHVTQVRIRRVDLRSVLLVERQSPEAIVFPQTGTVQLVPEFVRVLRDAPSQPRTLIR